METTNILPDNVHNSWNHMGDYHPYEANHSVSTQSLTDPRANYSGCHGCDGVATINEDGFHASLDVHQFTPKEITVKTVDNSIVIEAKHEAQPDKHGQAAQQFTRRYDLPKGFHPDHVVPELSSYGILNIMAMPENSVISEDKKEERDQTIECGETPRIDMKRKDERNMDDDIDK